jgi:hypothetical protein
MIKFVEEVTMRFSSQRQMNHCSANENLKEGECIKEWHCKPQKKNGRKS